MPDHLVGGIIVNGVVGDQFEFWVVVDIGGVWDWVGVWFDGVVVEFVVLFEFVGVVEDGVVEEDFGFVVVFEIGDCYGVVLCVVMV